MMAHLSERRREILFFVMLSLIAAAALLVSTRNILDSPRPWFDEGIYLQAARHLAETGRFGIVVAPGQESNLAFVTVGYPLIVSLATVFQLTGPTFEAARGTMVAFLVATVIAAGLCARALGGRKSGLAAAALVASFPPLYGNGKNVLGEVPGIFFLLLSVIFLQRISRSRGRRLSDWLLFGMAAVLATATKPQFLMVVPAAVLAVLLLRRAGAVSSWRGPLVAAGAFAVGLAVWGVTQFGGLPSPTVFFHYTNPYGVADVGATVLRNIVGFVSDPTPLHLLFIAGLTGLGWLVRRRVSAVEAYMGVVAIAVWAAYFRTAGWYRYFFIAHILFLVLLPVSWRGMRSVYARGVALVVLVLLLASNGYAYARDPAPLFGTDWRALRTQMQQIDPDAGVFFANAPEAAFFFRGREFGQYLRVTDRLCIGALPPLSEALPEWLVASDELSEIESYLPEYRLVARHGHVAVWQRR